MVSATDPVAVVALLGELGASKKLGTLIEGESLLNDGTAIVAFVLLIGVVTGAEAFRERGVLSEVPQLALEKSEQQVDWLEY